MIANLGSLEVVLAFADDEHIIGQRHTEWIGVAPFLEEDLAMSSIAQDELGHAAALYEIIVDEIVVDEIVVALSDEIDVDQLAFRRDPDDYRCCALVEHPNTDWAFSLVRHWLYDVAEHHRWKALLNSSHQRIADLAVQAFTEESYHTSHSQAMLTRLLNDPESRPLLVNALDTCLPLATSIFTPAPGEPLALQDGLITDTSEELFQKWKANIPTTFKEFQLEGSMPSSNYSRLTRTQHFQQLHSEINEVLDLAPTAPW